MLNTEEKDFGKNHWVVAYWNRVIGDRREDREKLKDVSPVNFAENFQAPVLLLHGDDDTVVPIIQSNVMNSALKKAGKDVEYIKLKGEDHYLSSSETRIEALKALDVFVQKHIGN